MEGEGKGIKNCFWVGGQRKKKETRKAMLQMRKTESLEQRCSNKRVSTLRGAIRNGEDEI